MVSASFVTELILPGLHEIKVSAHQRKQSIEKQPKGWDKSAKQTSDKGYVSRMYKSCKNKN